jgi:hypothetical protein
VVTVGGTPCLSVTSLNDSAVLCSTPGGVGTRAIQVNAGAQSSNANLTVSYELPSLTSVSPTSISPAGSTQLVLSGAGFGPSGTSGTAVTVGGQPCPIISASYTATQLSCVAPAGVGANVSVTIRVNGVTSNAVQLSYFAPQISSVTAQNVAAPQTAGGTTVVIAGLYFSSVLGTVTVNGTASCAVTNPALWTTSSITCQMPALAGRVTVVVTVGGQSSAPFDVFYAAPVINSVTPSNGPTAGGTTIFM